MDKPISTVSMSLAEFQELKEENFALRTQLSDLKKDYEELCNSKKIISLKAYKQLKQENKYIYEETIRLRDIIDKMSSLNIWQRIFNL
jgi:FtsZ-binding cell division protein ZapB